MPVIAYQSFNANSSKTHGIKALAMQSLTRATNADALRKGHQALVLPLVEGNLVLPVQGPANLVPIKPLTAPQTVPVFGAQIALVWQNIYRSFGSMPALMVCGELDTSNTEFTGIVTDASISLSAVSPVKACQSFTAISQTRPASQIQFLTSEIGYVVYTVAGLVVVFVHVPNKVATNKAATQQFYR